MEPCIEWPGKRSKQGYGLNPDSRNLAHRVAWTRVHGPIPPGMLICHRCDNPPCVNVEHLFLGTDKDNSEDCKRKRRHSFGRKAGLAAIRAVA